MSNKPAAELGLLEPESCASFKGPSGFGSGGGATLLKLLRCSAVFAGCTIPVDELGILCDTLTCDCTGAVGAGGAVLRSRTTSTRARPFALAGGGCEAVDGVGADEVTTVFWLWSFDWFGGSALPPAKGSARTAPFEARMNSV